MAELINEKDSLNEGRKKLNEAIKDSNKAKIDSSEAKTKAEQALSKSESTQEQLNQVVIDGDSSVEAAQARVDEKGQTHGTLKDRIDDGFTKVNSQLAETENQVQQLDFKKASKEEMNSGLNAKVDKNGAGQVTWAMAAQDLREQITGGNTAVVGKDSVLTENIVDKSVTPEKINNAKQGKNLFNKSKATPVLLRTSTGQEVPNEERRSSDFIKVLPNTTYVPKFSSRVIFYDENKQFISGIESYNGLLKGTPGEPFTTPSNCVYVRTSFHYADLKYYQLELGDVSTEYEPYHYNLESMVTVDESRSFLSKVDLEFNTDGKLLKVIEMIGNRTQITELFYAEGKLDYVTIEDVELGNKKRININKTEITEEWV